MFAPLPEGPLDVVGDVHGELDALLALLAHLGYDADGAHPDGRHLVFVGDLCDRGPDSPGVIAFLRSLPLALERDDLRVVHAAWDLASIAQLRAADPALSRVEHFRRWDADAEGLIAVRGIGAAARLEYEEYRERLVDPTQAVPMLVATAQVDEIRQMANPIRVVTSGIERGAARPFFASGHWRFVERIRWWDEYTELVPVIVGHYWRQFARVDRASLGKAEENLFTDLAPTAWHGLHRNVFCIDFSVGGRFVERPLVPGAVPRSRLGALRWPERVLALDTGEMLPTSDA